MHHDNLATLATIEHDLATMRRKERAEAIALFGDIARGERRDPVLYCYGQGCPVVACWTLEAFDAAMRVKRRGRASVIERHARA